MPNADRRDARDEVSGQLDRINESWHQGRPEELRELFHDSIVMVLPGFSDRARGADAVTAGFVDFSQNARIINVSTDSARAFATQLGYGASKAALEALTRSVAIEVGPYGISVNAVAPGPVQTGWIAPELEDELLPRIPMRRLGRPEDVADLIVFLASDRARWVTGQVIQVAGGHAL